MKALFFALFLGAMVQSMFGGNILGRDLLDTFPLGSFNPGFDDGDQASIDKREFDRLQTKVCEDCKTPKFEANCLYGVKPNIKSSNPAKNCSCITDYKCCPEKCNTTEKNLERCTDGKTYAVKTRDCCQCTEIICAMCPKINGNFDKQIQSNFVTPVVYDGTAGASSQFSSKYSAQKAFSQEDPEARWCSTAGYPAKIWFQFTSAVKVVKISFSSIESNQYPNIWTESPKAFNVIASNDCSTWDTLVSVTNSSFTGQNQEKSWQIPRTQQRSYRCYGIEGTENLGYGTDYISLKKLKMFQYSENCGNEELVKANYSGEPGASSEWRFDHNAAKAFKPQAGFPWASKENHLPATVWYRFNYNFKLAQISFTSRTGGDWVQTPKTFDIVGSNDCLNWNILKSVTNAEFTSGGQTKLWDIPCESQEVYECYGITAFAPIDSSGGNLVALTNIQMSGYIPATCADPCDRAESFPNPITKCPEYRCIRKVPTMVTPPKDCDLRCQRVETVTDNCGNHEQKCKCLDLPQCQPKQPADLACHITKKVDFDYFGCDNPINPTKCVRCFYWKYEFKPDILTKKQCKECEITTVEPTACGYETQCKCQTPPNCKPQKPDPIDCHVFEKIEEKASMCNNNGTCDRCYRWHLKPVNYTVRKLNCDSRCQFKRPKSTTCGSDEECVSIGKSKAQCQPPEPPTLPCYTFVKKLTPGSYMEIGGACSQCWTWEYQRKSCTIQSLQSIQSIQPVTRQCLSCQREVKEYTACGCYEIKCEGTTVPDCEPDEPPVDLDCYTQPKKKISNVSHYDVQKKLCTLCYSWDYEPITRQPLDFCKLRHLPGKCINEYEVKGKCNSVNKDCGRKPLPCTELYGGTESEVCPAGHKKVTLKTSCGDDRDACADCSSLVTSVSWSDPYPEKCYDTVEMTVLGQCPVKIKRKKQCSYKNDLVNPQCKDGQNVEVQMDECYCPSLVCTGCSNEKKIDMQLILDSSGSIGKDNWSRLIEFLRVRVIDSIFKNKMSKLAIAKYGRQMKVLQDWTDNVEQVKNIDMMSSRYQDYEPMGYTFTGECMEQLFPAFEKATSGSDADKVVMVLTDGEWNGYMNPSIPAEKYRNAGAKVIAIGFGNLSLTKLKDISRDDAHLLDDLNGVEEEIVKKIVPSICEEN